MRPMWLLRRKPDSALIWYEDFRDYGALPASYWTTFSGKWSVWRSDEYSEERVYSRLECHGQLTWKYDGFSDIHLRAQLIFLKSAVFAFVTNCGNGQQTKFFVNGFVGNILLVILANAVIHFSDMKNFAFKGSLIFCTLQFP